MNELFSFPKPQNTVLRLKNGFLDVCRKRLRELDVEDRCDFHAVYPAGLIRAWYAAKS